MSEKRPNVLLFFVDQMRGDAIGAAGNPVIRTPNLDRVAREGVLFTNAFSASPVCVSARCSTIYGQYPMHTGCYENWPMPVDDRESMMGALTGAGYRTHGIGKCHFSPDPDGLRGFQTRESQEELRGEPEKDSYMAYLHGKGYRYVCEPHGVRGEMYYVPQPSQLPPEVHPTNWVGDRSVAFVKEQADKGEPWYLFSSFIHPHPPFSPPNPWHKLYRAPLMPLPNVPADVEALQTHINRVQNRYKYRDQGVDQNLLRCMKAYYYACISFIDYQVGRVIAALEESDQLDDTVILFTGDHGEHLGDYNCFGKRSMHDSCARVPMLARWPGRLAAGQVCDKAVSLVDVAPTALDAAGTAIADHELDGVSLADIATGASGRDTVFAQISHGGRGDAAARAAGSTYMAVNRNWKYFYSAPDDREFLFDRVRDPRETRNLAGGPFRQNALASMKGELFEHLRAGGETAGINGDDWVRFPRREMPVNPDDGLLIQDPSWPDFSLAGYTDA